MLLLHCLRTELRPLARHNDFYARSGLNGFQQGIIRECNLYIVPIFHVLFVPTEKQ